MTDAISKDDAAQGLADIARVEQTIRDHHVASYEEMGLLLTGLQSMVSSLTFQFLPYDWAVAGMFTLPLAFIVPWHILGRSRIDLNKLSKPNRPIFSTGIALRLIPYVAMYMSIMLALDKAFSAKPMAILATLGFPVLFIGLTMAFRGFKSLHLWPLAFLFGSAMVCATVLFVPKAEQFLVAGFAVGALNLGLGVASRLARSRGREFP
jgi:hypothetical protein